MALETVSKNGVEIFSTGVFNGDFYSLSDLQAMVDSFGKLGFDPPIKIGHERGQEAPGASERLFGLPALGYVERLYLRGTKLLADLRDIPKRFADLINAGAYRRISAEVYFDLKEQGKTWPRVLKAISFLGAQIPALTNLKAIESLYQQGSIHLATFEFQEKEGRITMEQSEQNEGKQVSMSDASFALTEDIHAYAREHKIDFRTAAQRVFAEAAQGPGATHHLANLINGAVASGDMPLAVEIASSNPALARDCASAWIQAEAQKMIANEPGMASDHIGSAIASVIRENPEVGAMQSSGTVSEEALRAIFGQWFK